MYDGGSLFSVWKETAEYTERNIVFEYILIEMNHAGNLNIFFGYIGKINYLSENMLDTIDIPQN